MNRIAHTAPSALARSRCHARRNRCFGAVLAGLLLVLIAGRATAEVTAHAEVSKDVAAPGERLTYTLTIESTGETLLTSDLRFVTPPQFRNFRVLSANPSTGRKVQIVNGQSSVSYTYTWSLATAEAGDATISAARLQYKSQVLEAPPQTVRVTTESASFRNDRLQNLNVLPPHRTGNDQIDRYLQGRIFARLEFDTTEPYLKQTIVATCVVYADRAVAANIREVGWEEPSWVDFFAEPVDIGRLQLREADNLEGLKWMAVAVRRYLLTPTRSGDITIPISVVNAGIQVEDSRRRSPFDGFFNMDVFGRSTLSVGLPVAETTLSVLPLPTEGRPPSFQDAVGRFNFAGRVDRRQMSQDDLLTLTLEIGGEGYLGSVTQPRLPSLDDWAVTGSQSKIDAENNLTSLRGKKSFEIILRPERVGQLTIPNIAYAFFDPADGRYVEQTAGPFVIQVTRGADQPLIVESNHSNGNGARREKRVYGEAMRHIRTALPPAGVAPPLYRRPSFLAIVPLPALLLATALAWNSWRRYRRTHAHSLQRRGAGGRARRELRDARAALAQNDPKQFHQRLAEALRGYLAIKLGRSASGLTLDEIENACIARGVDPKHASDVRLVLEHCDEARYVASHHEKRDLEGLLADAGELLRELDKTID